MDQAGRLALEAAEAARKLHAPLVEGRAILLASGAAQNLGNLPQAQRLLRQARTLCEPLHDLVCLAAIHRIDANASLALHNSRQAVDLYGKALELARLSGNPRERFNAINRLGHALLQDHQFPQAESVFRSALKLDLASLGLHPEGFYTPSPKPSSARAATSKQANSAQK